MTTPEIKKMCYKIGVSLLLVIVGFILIGKIRTPNKAEKERLKILASCYPKESIAPIYTERMLREGYLPTTDFRLVELTDTMAAFLATMDCRNGQWSCSFVLNLHTMNAVMRREYDGDVVQAKVKFSPNEYGGFDLNYNYEDGKTAHSTFIPKWHHQPEGLTVGSLAKGLIKTIGGTPID